MNIHLNSSASKLADSLVKICGHKNITVEEEEIVAAGFHPLAHPEVIARPRTFDEIREVLALAESSGSSIIPFGGGTQIRQVCGESHKAIGVCMNGFELIREFEPDNLSITVEAGTTNADLQEMAQRKNLQFPVAADFAKSTIGGEIACNFSSWKRYRYGAANDQVLGLTFISPTGKIIKAGGKTVKNVSGYDLTKLLGGSWGTLGILLLATLKLFPLPQRQLVLIRNFSSVHDAIEEAKQILSGRPQISSLNLFSSPDQDESLILALAIEGSGEFVDSQLKKHLNLSPSWEGLEHQKARQEYREVHLRTRREIKRDFFNTVVFDKRAVADTRKAVHYLMRHRFAFDFDLSAGVLEYALPGHPLMIAEEYWTEWNDAVAAIDLKTKGMFPYTEPSPALQKILPKVDPHRIMFRNNLFVRR